LTLELDAIQSLSRKASASGLSTHLFQDKPNFICIFPLCPNGGPPTKTIGVVLLESMQPSDNWLVD